MTTLNSRLKLALITPKKAKNAMQKGFTLIELLIVVVIMGVLSAVAIPNVFNAKDKADKNASLASTIAMAQECQNAIMLSTTIPTFTSDNLVTVGTGTCGTNSQTFETAVAQSAAAGTKCIKDQATSSANTTCTITITKPGDKSGAWS